MENGNMRRYRHGTLGHVSALRYSFICVTDMSRAHERLHKKYTFQLSHFTPLYRRYQVSVQLTAPAGTVILFRDCTFRNKPTHSQLSSAQSSYRYFCSTSKCSRCRKTLKPSQTISPRYTTPPILPRKQLRQLRPPLKSRRLNCIRYL